MLTTTSETLGSAKAPVLRRVTTTTFLHRGFLTRSCTMRPPTFPVAPRTIVEYCAFASAAVAVIVTSHARNQKYTQVREREKFCWVGRFLHIISTFTLFS